MESPNQEVMGPAGLHRSRYPSTEGVVGFSDLDLESNLDKVLAGHRSGIRMSRAILNSNDPEKLAELVVLWKQEELRATTQYTAAVEKLDRLRSRGVDVDSYIVAKWGNSSIFSLMDKHYQPVEQPRALMLNNPHNTRGRAREAAAENQNADAEGSTPESEQKNAEGGSVGSTGGAEGGSVGSTGGAEGGSVGSTGGAEGGSVGSTGGAEAGSEGSTGAAPAATPGDTGGENAGAVVSQESDPEYLPSSASESSGEANGGGPTPGDAAPAVRTAGNGLPVEGTITFTTNQFAELMETLRTPKPAPTTEDFKLQYKFQMFSGDDADWIGFKRQLISYMNGRGVSRETMKSYVADFRENGTRPPPRVSTLLNSIFTTSLKREALSITNRHADAFDAYIALLKRYEPKRTTRLLGIINKLSGGLEFKKNLDEFFRQFDDLNEQLELFNATFKEPQLLACIVNSLPARYETAVSQIGVREDCSLEEAKAIIESLHDKLLVTTQQQNRSTHSRRSYSAAVGGRGRNNSNTGGNQRRVRFPSSPSPRPRQDIKCFRCGEPGHFASKCKNVTSEYKCRHCNRNHLEKLCKDRPSETSQAMAVTTSTTVGSSTRESSRVVPQRTRVYHAEDRRWRDPQPRCFLFRQEPSFNWTDDVENSDEDSDSGEDEDWEGISGYALTANNSTQESFYIDSGATDHLTGNIELFSSFVFEDLPPLTVANGEQLQVVGRGSIRLNNGCVIRNVLYSPRATSTLLSVSRLTQNGWSLCIRMGGSSLDSDRLDLSIPVDSRDGMYQLRVTPLLPEGESVITAGIAAKVSDATRSLLHRRFGHANKKSLEELEKATENSQSGIRDHCPACIMGKSHRTSASKEYAGDEERRGATVYIDILGPFPEGYGSIRNYLVCLHHKSKYLDVFPLTKKTGVLEATAEYCLRYSDFDFLQADMDGVFISGEFQRLCRENGKQLRYTTPHRHEFHPVERYNRTLMDKARSMLVDSQLSQQFFLPFAVETAAVLNNWTPRDGMTPHERRFGDKPDVGVVRVFGCRAFVHNPSPYPKHKPGRETLCYYLLGCRNSPSAHTSSGTYSRSLLYTLGMCISSKIELSRTLSTTLHTEMRLIMMGT